MRRIQRSGRALPRRRGSGRPGLAVPLALAAAAAFALVCSGVVTSSAPAQNPSAPDSSIAPPDQKDEPLGPGPEVGAEPSLEPPVEQAPPPGAAPSAAAQSNTTGAIADSTGARADSTSAKADSTSAKADSTGARADTSAFVPSGVVKPAAEAPFDTLSLPTTPPPTNSSAGPAIGSAHPPTPPVAPPKQRVGILGLHPAAILIGLAALNYFIVKWATD